MILPSGVIDPILFIAYTHNASLFPLTFKYLYTGVAQAWHTCQ